MKKCNLKTKIANNFTQAWSANDFVSLHLIWLNQCVYCSSIMQLLQFLLYRTDYFLWSCHKFHKKKLICVEPRTYL